MLLPLVACDAALAVVVTVVADDADAGLVVLEDADVMRVADADEVVAVVMRLADV